MPSWFRKIETLLLVAAIALTLAAGVAYWFYRTTTLTIAVAPRDGTEPELIQAYSDLLDRNGEDIRLKIQSFPDVDASAEALRSGRADLAVVRPDVALPGNGLTLAILRDQAMMIASPEASGIKSFPVLAHKRLGMVQRREADLRLLKTLLGYYGLSLLDGTNQPEGPEARHAVTLVQIGEDEVTAAFTAKRIDAVLAVIAPAAPKALALIAAVEAASRDGRVAFVEAPDDQAIIERFPKLQAVTIPAGLFGGRPKVPGEDVKTVGASYRLMADKGLSRTAAADMTQQLFELRAAVSERTPAADYIKAPDYETTAAATSARLPNHPGAVDYYEREQRGFVDRYGDLIYLVAFLAGGLGSAAAWLRERIDRQRRERTEAGMDRLLEIAEEARAARDPEALAALSRETDRLAVEIVRDARAHAVDPQTMSTVALAIDAARSAVGESRRGMDGRAAAVSW